MAAPASVPAPSEATEGPVLSLLNKRLRALRKKLNRITQMEESIAQGKPINKEQEEVLRSKPSVLASIDELEKFRQPLAAAVSEEIADAIELCRNQQPLVSNSDKDESKTNNSENSESNCRDAVEDLLNLLYFGSLFDVMSQSDFTAVMLTRTHERECCLTYDVVTDDATDLLGERDLNMISSLSGLLISRPVDSNLSHKDALQQCKEHAKLWLANSEKLIDANANVSYAELRERLNKIKSSHYFTTTPEMKAPDEVVAAAGNYASFQVPMHGTPVHAQVEGSVVHDQEKDEISQNFQGHGTVDNRPSSSEEVQKDEVETENTDTAEVVPSQQEQIQPTAELEHNQRVVEPMEQHYNSRRQYQSKRGGRGGSSGGRRGYSNGRGGQIGGRGGGIYQNGRNQYYDQPGNYYPRHYNNRGRGGRGGAHAPADDRVAAL